jgi:glycosyltransferase involved in cell wall biosynthesis
MIDVIDYDDGLPISIIIPHGRSGARDKFFNNMVFPLIEANEPIEIIINSDLGKAPKKRNDGFKKSTQPFVFFCDNDVLLPKNYLKTLHETLLKNPDCGFAYTGYHGIVLDTAVNHPLTHNFRIPTVPFNPIILKNGNYISTMSLVRRECLPQPNPFDENLKRLQDWDFYLTMVNNGIKGISVPDIEYFAYYIDEGITSNKNNEYEAYMAVVNKHNLTGR